MKDTSVFLPSFDEELGNRLKIIVKKVGGGESAAHIAGVSENMISRYVKGHSKPSFQALALLAQSADVSLDWLAGFTKENQKEYHFQNHNITIKTQYLNKTDSELLAHLNGIINRAYKDMGGRVSPEDMGRIAAEKYTSILEASDDPEERLIMAKLFETELRKELESKQKSGNTKASA